MNNGNFTIHHPVNEAGMSYKKGSAEKESLKKELMRQYDQKVEIPCIINGKEVYTGNTIELIVPYEKKHVLGVCHLAGAKTPLYRPIKRGDSCRMISVQLFF